MLSKIRVSERITVVDRGIPLDVYGINSNFAVILQLLSVAVLSANEARKKLDASSAYVFNLEFVSFIVFDIHVIHYQYERK